jgi:hypothetical protein
VGEETPTNPSVERQSNLSKAETGLSEVSLEVDGGMDEVKVEMGIELRKCGSRYDDSYDSEDDDDDDCESGDIFAEDNQMRSRDSQRAAASVCESSETCGVAALAMCVNAQLRPTEAIVVVNNTPDKNKYDATDVILQAELPEFDPHNQYLDSFIQVHASPVHDQLWMFNNHFLFSLVM